MANLRNQPPPVGPTRSTGADLLGPLHTPPFHSDRIHEVFGNEKVAWRISPTDVDDSQPLTVLGAVARRFPEIPVVQWPARHDWGGLLVNGRPCELEQVLKAGDGVEYFVPPAELVRTPDGSGFTAERLRAAFPAWEARQQLYHERGLLVAYKPAGLPTRPPKSQRQCSLYDFILTHLKDVAPQGPPELSLEDEEVADLPKHLRQKQKQQKMQAQKQAQELGKKKDEGWAVHMPSRLDQGTWGIVALSTNRLTHSALQSLWKVHVTKSYVFEAVVPQKAWSWLGGRWVSPADIRGQRLVQAFVSETLPRVSSSSEASFAPSASVDGAGEGAASSEGLSKQQRQRLLRKLRKQLKEAAEESASDLNRNGGSGTTYPHIRVDRPIGPHPGSTALRTVHLLDDTPGAVEVENSSEDQSWQQQRRDSPVAMAVDDGEDGDRPWRRAVGTGGKIQNAVTDMWLLRQVRCRLPRRLFPDLVSESPCSALSADEDQQSRMEQSSGDSKESSTGTPRQRPRKRAKIAATAAASDDIESASPGGVFSDLPVDEHKIVETSAVDHGMIDCFRMWVLAKPRTGRTHQIRVHAASLGMRIAGDDFYGGFPTVPESQQQPGFEVGTVPDGSLHLCSFRIQLPHPLGWARREHAERQAKRKQRLAEQMKLQGKKRDGNQRNRNRSASGNDGAAQSVAQDEAGAVPAVTTLEAELEAVDVRVPKDLLPAWARPVADILYSPRLP